MIWMRSACHTELCFQKLYFELDKVKISILDKESNDINDSNIRLKKKKPSSTVNFLDPHKCSS